jgi:hypothetical protein
MKTTLWDVRPYLLALPAIVMALSAAEVASSQESSGAEALLARVADAMGGADAILGVRTLEASGYGAEAYFWGGGNVTGDPEAVQKWAENPEMAAIWDFENDRYQTRYRHNFMFPFGGTFGHSFSMSTWGLDGDVGYTAGGFGGGQRLAEWTTSGSWF